MIIFISSSLSVDDQPLLPNFQSLLLWKEYPQVFFILKSAQMQAAQAHIHLLNFNNGINSYFSH